MGLSNYVPNSRLAQPGVCTSTTRPATPYEGQVIYETDTNRVLVWDASAWVMIADTDAPPALQLVSSFVANGTNRALVCDNIFTTEFDNYKVVGSLRSTVNTNALFYQYLDTSGNNVGSGYWGTAYGQDFTTGSNTFYNLTLSSVQYVGYIPNSTSAVITFSMDIYGPRLSSNTTNVTGQYSGISSGAYYVGGQILGMTTGATEFRGLRFDNGGAGNMTGTVRVYGYRN